MNTISAKDARANFSEMLSDVRVSPITIQKNGRDVAVLISAEDYARLEALEDAWWAEKARKAQKKGYIGAEATNKLIQSILSTND